MAEGLTDGLGGCSTECLISVTKKKARYSLRLVHAPVSAFIEFAVVTAMMYITYFV